MGNHDHIKRIGIVGEEKDRYIKYGLDESVECISTGNSAYGALNLAYHMNPKDIVILGVNGDRNSPKFDNKHSLRLDHLPKIFESSIKKKLERKGIKVYNANK